MINFISIFIISILILKCANPNYQEASNSIKRQQLQGCQIDFRTENICGFSLWQIMPTESRIGQFKLILSPGIEENLELDVYLWMPSMSHGSSPVKVKKISETEFIITEVFFIMPGEWEIRYQLKIDEQVIDEAIQNITI